MKKVLKESMESMLTKTLTEFSHEKEQDPETIKCYTDKFIDDFERYLRAYNEFKEEN